MNLTKLVTDPRVDALYCTLASFCPVDLSLHPHNLSNRPEWRLFLDALTDLFNTMHVASVVHARLEATAPWGLIREAEDEGGNASFVWLQESAVAVSALRYGCAWQLLAERKRDSGVHFLSPAEIASC